MCKHILYPGFHRHDWTPRKGTLHGEAGTTCSHVVKYTEAQEVTYDERYCSCDTLDPHDPTEGGTRPPWWICTTNVQVPCADCIKDEYWTKGHGTSMVPYKGKLPVPTST